MKVSVHHIHKDTIEPCRVSLHVIFGTTPLHQQVQFFFTVEDRRRTLKVVVASLFYIRGTSSVTLRQYHGKRCRRRQEGRSR